MRADARSLLDRLGRSDFAYKQFADRFSDLELWPMFEALLKDPRTFQQDMALNGDRSAPEAAPTIAIGAARPAGAMHSDPAPMVSFDAEPLAEYFVQYEAEVGTRLHTHQNENIKVMLRRMSDLNEPGEL